MRMNSSVPTESVRSLATTPRIPRSRNQSYDAMADGHHTMWLSRIARLLEFLTFFVLLFAGSAQLRTASCISIRRKARTRTNRMRIVTTVTHGQSARPDLIRANLKRVRRAPLGANNTDPRNVTF